ncbi:unnamed protein product [Paramecium octaurelia]|uniref:Uncharacterized protein n=1 Tax=Paramecium octaurelia TaxID=43137 RepID=A0A8S1X1F9_PAROT|nr:unnamed protein product [Paramecium octaurelia]
MKELHYFDILLAHMICKKKQMVQPTLWTEFGEHYLPPLFKDISTILLAQVPLIITLFCFKLRQHS